MSIAGGCDDELEPPVAPGRVLDGRPDQLGEPALDPLAGEVVRNREHERVVAESDRLDVAEPGPERVLVECPPEPRRDVAPEALGS